MKSFSSEIFGELYTFGWKEHLFMRTVVDQFRDVIVQIATPYNTGTGFYLKSHDLIVTNEHIVHDNKEVVIKGEQFEKQLSQVLFTDDKCDLAFLEAPASVELPTISLGNDNHLSEGDPILSIGHPFGLEFSVTKGVISNTSRSYEGITYLQHDAALNPGNSGGPLINQQGEVVGVNALSIDQGDNIGFSLPVSYLKEALDGIGTVNGAVKTRCISCQNFLSEQTIDNKKYCPHCGAKVLLASYASSYEPTGVTLRIEELLESIGHDVRISRKGPNNWEIFQGSARIDITYHEDTGLIMGDAYLCRLPSTNIQPIYEFLLRQNYGIDGLTFSIKEQDIILSLLIFDRYLNLDTGTHLFKHLFERADYFDNVLVEEYGALWK